MSYDIIERVLRDNLDDDDYAKAMDALDAAIVAERVFIGMTDDEIEELDMETSGTVHDFVRVIEANLKEKNT